MAQLPGAGQFDFFSAPCYTATACGKDALWFAYSGRQIQNSLNWESENMVRPVKPCDIDKLSRIWLDCNVEAHSFIPEAYWESKAPEVSRQLAAAELYVAEDAGRILGFAGLQGDYLAGIFVESAQRSRGIGRQLLDHIKNIRPAFSLSVYQKNTRAVSFYIREGFRIVSEGRDDETGEADFTMAWE